MVKECLRLNGECKLEFNLQDLKKLCDVYEGYVISKNRKAFKDDLKIFLERVSEEINLRDSIRAFNVNSLVKIASHITPDGCEFGMLNDRIGIWRI